MPYADPEKRRANYHKKDRAAVLAKQRAMYQKHRAKRLAAKKADRDADPEAARAYQRAMYAKHREKRVAEARARRAANREAEAAKARARYHAGGEQLKARRRELAKAPHRRAKQYELTRRWLEQNPDKALVAHAKRLLNEQTGIAIKDIPNEVAEAKAEQLKIVRWVKEEIAKADQSPKGEDAKRLSSRERRSRSDLPE